MPQSWVAQAVARYEHCNRHALEWLVERGELDGGFLNSKVNSITGVDYDDTSGVRGPKYTYGTIQGRGLEALSAFAAYYLDKDPALSKKLHRMVVRLYSRMSALQAKDGHIFFLYGPNCQPVIEVHSQIKRQRPEENIYTLTDAFAAKGLVAAAAYLELDTVEHHLAYLNDVVSAIEDHRFQMNGRIAITQQAVNREPLDFGPRMILIGASGVLQRYGLADSLNFADRFINHILERHYDCNSGLLLAAEGGDISNIGHTAEFCGLAFEHLSKQPHDPRIHLLKNVLIRSLQVGLRGPGCALNVTVQDGALVSPEFPWWPLPEAIRACALGFELTGDLRLHELWQQADTAFFHNYWQRNRGYAFQNRDLNNPVESASSMPDLDPGYHTGLCLLSALNCISTAPPQSVQ